MNDMHVAFDAVLVPGGGLLPDGTLPPWVINRLERAAARAGQAAILTLSAGTTHKPPPLDARGSPRFESVEAARFLVAQGVAPERILTETASYDTIGNAYFSRVIHAEPRAPRLLLVIITSMRSLMGTSPVCGWNTAVCVDYSAGWDGVGAFSRSPSGCGTIQGLSTDRCDDERSEDDHTSRKRNLRTAGSAAPVIERRKRARRVPRRDDPRV